MFPLGFPLGFPIHFECKSRRGPAGVRKSVVDIPQKSVSFPKFAQTTSLRRSLVAHTAEINSLVNNCLALGRVYNVLTRITKSRESVRAVVLFVFEDVFAE